MSDKPTACIHLDGTTGMECVFQGPYHNTRNKPSLAKRAYGTSHALSMLRLNVPFLMCQPAVDRGLKPDYDDLVEAQCHCSKYKERG